MSCCSAFAARLSGPTRSRQPTLPHTRVHGIVPPYSVSTPNILLITYDEHQRLIRIAFLVTSEESNVRVAERLQISLDFCASNTDTQAWRKEAEPHHKGILVDWWSGEPGFEPQGLYVPNIARYHWKLIREHHTTGSPPWKSNSSPCKLPAWYYFLADLMPPS